MDPLVAALGVGVLVLVGLVLGALARRPAARRTATGDDFTPASLGIDAFGTTATLVQFSTEFCARCPGVRRALGELVATRDDVVLTEYDLTHDPEAATRLRILQTPTVFVLNAHGTPVARYGGQISIPAITTELDSLRKVPR